MLGVTESRVSQLHTKAVLRLRARAARRALDRLSRPGAGDAPICLYVPPVPPADAASRGLFGYTAPARNTHARGLRRRCRTEAVAAGG